MTAPTVNKQALRVASFALVLVVIVVALKALNWVPGALEPGLMSRYPTVEDAIARLGLRQVYIPAYFPESLASPPAMVLAQSQPYQAVVMEFAGARDGQIALVVTQAASADFAAESVIRFRSIHETVPVDLGGRVARLEAGECEDGSPCSRIRWREDEVHIAMAMRAPGVELVPIARSMHR